MRRQRHLGPDSRRQRRAIHELPHLASPCGGASTNVHPPTDEPRARPGAERADAYRPRKRGRDHVRPVGRRAQRLLRGRHDTRLPNRAGRSHHRRPKFVQRRCSTSPTGSPVRLRSARGRSRRETRFSSRSEATKLHANRAAPARAEEPTVSSPIPTARAQATGYRQARTAVEEALRRLDLIVSCDADQMTKDSPAMYSLSA